MLACSETLANEIQFVSLTDYSFGFTEGFLLFLAVNRPKHLRLLAEDLISNNQ